MPTAEDDFAPTAGVMPTLFVGHGSPMNAIEDNEFSQAWIAAGKELPRPAAILCVSAHWETHGTFVTAMERPRTIHDFGGFPRALHEQQYPTPGSPALASLIRETTMAVEIGGVTEMLQIHRDHSWGLDHGAWSVLMRLFPHADVPVVQLSLDRARPPVFHYALGQALSPLRRRGVLIVGSGNIVHNLGVWCQEDRAYDWALSFDDTIRRLVEAGDHQAIVDFGRLGMDARLAIPTNEHFLPLLYVLGAHGAKEPLRFFAEKVTYCSMSMRSIRVG